MSNLAYHSTLTCAMFMHYLAGIGIGFDPVSYTVDEGATVDVCVSRLSGTLSRRLTVTLSVLSSDMSAGNASCVCACVKQAMVCCSIHFYTHNYDYSDNSSPMYTADINSQDYIVVSLRRDLDSTVSRVCASVRALDEHVIEDLEFYQISLSSSDVADIVPELSLANVFIMDNDGKLLQ